MTVSASKKRVMHVTFDMAIGGTEQVIVNLIEHTNRDQYDIHVFCIEQPIGALGQKLIDKGIHFISTARKPKLDFALINKMRKYIVEHKIDIVHCHQYSPYIYGLFASLFTQAKVIFTEHGRLYPDIPSLKRRMLNPLLSQFTYSIICISAATKQALVDIEAISASKIDVIYNGISDKSGLEYPDTQLKKALNITPEDTVFGTISRLDPIKNQTMMIKAFAQVNRTYNHTKLLIIGDGDSRNELENTAKQQGIEHCVIFTGFQVNPQQYLNIMDVFLLSSLSEGTSMTLLEAMAFSKPSVVTDAGGNTEIIQHNFSGLVTPNEDQAAFANAMLNLIQKDELKSTLGYNARQEFIKRFDVVSMSNAYADLYSA